MAPHCPQIGTAEPADGLASTRVSAKTRTSRSRPRFRRSLSADCTERLRRSIPKMSTAFCGVGSISVSLGESVVKGYS